MRILVFVQGSGGKRIFRNIKERSPAGWTVECIDLPAALPAIIDEPQKFITQDLPKADLILFLGESPQAPQLIPDAAVAAGAKAVIAPIDNSGFMPLGMKNQVQRRLAGLGVAAAFPKTFCTLTENSYGYRRSVESYDSELIAAFARYFGRPKLKIKIDPETNKIEAVEVERGAPCGSTHYAAAGLVGLSANEAVPKAALICHYYPCHASMQQEQIDKDMFDTLMHLSGYVINEAVEEAM
ncbi:MAG: DUF166 family protein [Dehalococcoidia bacterium]|nr:hypothetical protein [Chloroflexota bacterium]MBT9160617.1 hypothetical protein [Chloroflexota bacterium]MBT9162699.1 hypothetical protein [Chloroflexota bacterium]